MDHNSNQLKISLQSFDGPLDVLESLIRDRKMDIRNLNIASLADQYLKFINQNIRNITMDVASDYLVMATYLLELKSKKIIPESSPDIANNFEEERDQFVNRILAYRQYKQTLPKFAEHHDNRANYFAKDSTPLTDFIAQRPVIEQLPKEISSEKLFKSMNEAYMKYRSNMISKQQVSVKEVSVDEVKQDVLNYLKTNKQFSFEDFLMTVVDLTKQYLVTCFLAILELAKYRDIKIQQTDHSIYIEANEDKSDIDEYDYEENK